MSCPVCKREHGHHPGCLRPVFPPTPKNQDALDMDESAKLADALSLEAGVEDALLAAEDIARRSNEPELADCLARLEVMWNMGSVGYALALLNRARDSALEALTAVTDEEGICQKSS